MICDTCGRDLKESDFYHFKIGNQPSTTCKKCECEKYDKDAFCKRYNIPNIKEEWEQLEDRVNLRHIEDRRYFMYGRYLSKMKLKGYLPFGYGDSDQLNRDRSEYVIKEINYEISKLPNDKTDFISDGAHTFGDLYEQRAYLFAAIVNSYPERSYKSWRHSDGERCFGSEGWFIVGIATPEGQYTYHYEKKYWDLFKCGEVDTAPAWDGHTDKDVSRLLSLILEA